MTDLREEVDVPEGGFGVAYADPPWSFMTHSGKAAIPQRAVEQHYEVMSAADLQALNVADVCAKDCVLIMWTTSSNLPEALALGAAWGFKYKSLGMIWIKVKLPTITGYMRHIMEPLFKLGFVVIKPLIGMGFWFRQEAEICLLFTRGKPKRLKADVRQVIFDVRREHSRKPEEALRRIERLVCGPYLELFSRGGRPGWSVWGNETKKFAQEEEDGTRRESSPAP